MKSTLGLLTILLVCAGCVDIQKLTDDPTQPKATEAESYSLDTNRFYGLTLNKSTIDKITEVSKYDKQKIIFEEKTIFKTAYDTVVFDMISDKIAPSNKEMKEAKVKTCHILFIKEVFVGIFIKIEYPVGEEENAKAEFDEYVKKYGATIEKSRYSATGKGKKVLGAMHPNKLIITCLLTASSN